MRNENVSGGGKEWQVLQDAMSRPIFYQLRDSVSIRSLYFCFSLYVPVYFSLEKIFPMDKLCPICSRVYLRFISQRVSSSTPDSTPQAKHDYDLV